MCSKPCKPLHNLPRVQWRRLVGRCQPGTRKCSLRTLSTMCFGALGSPRLPAVCLFSSGPSLLYYSLPAAAASPPRRSLEAASASMSLGTYLLTRLPPPTSPITTYFCLGPSLSAKLLGLLVPSHEGRLISHVGSNQCRATEILPTPGYVPTLCSLPRCTKQIATTSTTVGILYLAEYVVVVPPVCPCGAAPSWDHGAPLALRARVRVLFSLSTPCSVL